MGAPVITPCPSCPWRRGARAQDIPRFKAAMACDLATSRMVMACHLSTDSEPVPCAGWVVQVAVPGVNIEGEGAIPMRLLVRRAGIDLDAYGDGGLGLHPDMRAMSDAIVASAGGAHE